MSRGGRGRGGKGRGSQLSFNVEAVGLGRGEPLPGPVLQPPPYYPPLQTRPNTLHDGEDKHEMFNIKTRFLNLMQNSPYYIKAEVKNKGIKRYSDKYHVAKYSDATIGWQPDWRRFPKELRIDVRKKRNKDSKKFPVNIKKKKSTLDGDKDVVKHLEELEKKDEENDDENKTSKEKEEGSEEEDTMLEDAAQDDEVYEEENDYLTSYFDNGDDFIDEEEDALEDKDGGIF